MNRKVGMISSIIVALTVALFAFGMLFFSANFSYFVCIILSWGYVLLVCSFLTEIPSDRRALGYGGLAFACIYAVFIDLVYYTQLTTVTNRLLSPEAMDLLAYAVPGSLMFNLDLFGYGMMALSTLFIGLAFIPSTKSDRALKILLIVHGTFAISSVLMPMMDLFKPSPEGNDSLGGVIALMFWCLYFLPVGILSFFHFLNRKS